MSEQESTTIGDRLTVSEIVIAARDVVTTYFGKNEFKFGTTNPETLGKFLGETVGFAAVAIAKTELP